MNEVILELEEQLRYAEGEDPNYSAQLKKAIGILKHYEEGNSMAVEPMQDLTLAGLRSAMNTDKARAADYFIFHLAGNGEEGKDDEIIINPKANFQAKLQSIMATYNEDLSQRDQPRIHISKYHFLTAEELKHYF